MTIYTIRVEFDPQQRTLLGTTAIDFRKFNENRLREDTKDRIQDVTNTAERMEVWEVSTYKTSDKAVVKVEVEGKSGVSQKVMRRVRDAVEAELGATSKDVFTEASRV